METKFDAAYKRIMKDILGKPEIVSKGNEKVNPNQNAEIEKAKDDPTIAKIDGTTLDTAKAPVTPVNATGKGLLGKPAGMGMPDEEKAKQLANQTGTKLV